MKGVQQNVSEGNLKYNAVGHKILKTMFCFSEFTVNVHNHHKIVY